MKILVDENIPRMTVEWLKNHYDVLDLRGGHQQGIVDDEVWKLAQQEQRLLITTDKGFLRFRLEPHFGLLIIRMHQPSRIGIHNRVILGLQSQLEDEWAGLAVVIRDTAQSVWRSSF